MAFETLFDASQGTVFKFENKGDVLEGYFMGSFDYTGDYGPTKRHVFQTENGAVLVFGQRHLMQKLPEIKPGTMVRITYNEDLAPKSKGRAPMKLFKFEQDKKNTVEVSGVDFEAQTNFEDVSDDDVDTPDTVEDTIVPERATRPVSPATPNPTKTQQLLGGLRSRNKTA